MEYNTLLKAVKSYIIEWYIGKLSKLGSFSFVFR